MHKWLDRHFPEYPKLFSNLLGATCLGLLEEYKGPDSLKDVPFKVLTEKIYALSRGKLGLKLAKKLKTRAAEAIGKTIAPTAARARLDNLLSRISTLLKEINQLESTIKEQLNYLKESNYLLSIPGVGWWGAAVFLGEVGNPTRLPRARSAVKLAGLNLYRTQSGKSKSGLSITKRGSSPLRKAAYQMALVGIKSNQEFKNFYERKIERGKAKVSSLVALSAKVLRVMYGVVKNEENYLPLEERQNNRA